MLCVFCQAKIIAKNGKKFCSSSCAAKYNNRAYPKRTKAKKIVKCGWCDNLMVKGDKKYCSLTCYFCYLDSRRVSDEHEKIKNGINQSKWRAKKRRVLAPSADVEKINETYQNCPSFYEVDHIIPLSRGGLHHENNLQRLPKKENGSKGDKIWCAVPDSN